MRLHPPQATDDADDENEDPQFRPKRLTHAVAEQKHYQQEQGELWQRQEEIGQPHQNAVEHAPKKPARAPMTMPSRMAMSMAARPTAMEIRPP